MINHSHDLSLLPTYSEDGSTMILVIQRSDTQPLHPDEIADILIAYSAKLLGEEPPQAN